MAAIALEAQLSELSGDAAEAWIDTGLIYQPNEPVRILVRRRDGRYDMSDGAAALSLAGRPHEWLATMEQVVAEHGLNVNRRGVVFVTGFPGRDLDLLVAKLAECSRTAYLALLDSGDD